MCGMGHQNCGDKNKIDLVNKMSLRMSETMLPSTDNKNISVIN